MDQGLQREQGDNWLDDFLPYRLFRVTTKSDSRMLNRLRKQQINPSQWRVLAVLKSYGTMSMSMIAETTCMEQPTVSRVVGQLDEQGHVTRRLSEQDARVAMVSLTDKGFATFDQIAPAAVRQHELAIKGLSRKELTTLLGLLAKVEDNLAQLD